MRGYIFGVFYFNNSKKISTQEQKPKGYRAYQRVSAKQTTPVRKQRPKSQDKSIKQLLGELYKDKEYLEKLLEETGIDMTLLYDKPYCF